MTNKINVFPKSLTIFSLIFLLLVLGFGLYSQFRTSQLLTSFQMNDIPTLQLSSAATGVINETELLLSGGELNREKVSFRALVLEDSLKELLLLTNDFPEVPSKFASSSSYSKFQKYLSSDLKTSPEENMFTDLKGDVQTLVEDYLVKKNKAIRRQVFFGYLSSGISFLGVLFFFFLLFAIYRRYQKNLERLEVVTQNLEQERLVSIQSSRLASLGEMAAGLAHEINNPLAVIIGRAEIITSLINNGEATDLEISKTISKINEMAKRIALIVTSMRKISKQADQSAPTKINLFSVIEDVLNLSSERLQNLSIVLDLSGLDKNINVNANFSHLSQILINLMNNGIDELQKQPEENRFISFSTEELEREVLLKIKDSGTGIPAKVREKLFQPFFTTKDVGKGTGLGLSISKNLMQEMGGTLELSPDLKQTCFILRFSKS
jgi:signal transduction histidine kinase